MSGDWIAYVMGLGTGWCLSVSVYVLCRIIDDKRAKAKAALLTPKEAT